MFAFLENNYIQTATGVPVERSNINPFFRFWGNKELTSFTESVIIDTSVGSQISKMPTTCLMVHALCSCVADILVGGA